MNFKQFVSQFLLLIFCACDGLIYLQKGMKYQSTMPLNDLSGDLKETRIFDFYYPINKSTFFLDSLFIFSSKNGKLHIMEMDKYRIIESLKLKYPMEHGVVYHNNSLYFSFGTGKYNLQKYNIIEKKFSWESQISAYLSSEICLNDSLLFVGALNGKIYVISTDDGSVRYHIQGKKAVRSKPILINHILFFADDAGIFYAYDIQNRQLKWKIQATDRPFYADPQLYKQYIYLLSQNGQLIKIDVNSGAIIWQKKFDSYAYASPAINNKGLFFGTNSGHFYHLNHEGQEIWNYQSNFNINSSAYLGKENVYFGNGHGDFFILKQDNGAELTRKKYTGRFYASPIMSTNGLILFTDKEDMILLQNLANF